MIPEIIKQEIKDESEEILPYHHGIGSKPSIQTDSERELFKQAAEFGYSLAESEIERLKSKLEYASSGFPEQEKQLMELQITGLKRMDELNSMEIERLKGLIDDAFNAGYDNGAYANDSDLQANYEPPMTLEQFKKENNLQ